MSAHGSSSRWPGRTCCIVIIPSTATRTRHGWKFSAASMENSRGGTEPDTARVAFLHSGGDCISAQCLRLRDADRVPSQGGIPLQLLAFRGLAAPVLLLAQRTFCHRHLGQRSVRGTLG